MRTIILDDWENALSNSLLLTKLREFSEVVVYDDQPTPDQLKERLGQADVVIPIRERTKFTKELLEELDHIKLIAQTGSGIAHIDMEEVNKRKIPVATTKGSVAAVTELSFAMILACSRNLVGLHNETVKGLWPVSMGTNIKGKTLGIIGLGSIGSSVAKVAKSFGMHVVAWGPTLTKERAEAVDVNYLPLEKLLQESHFVSLHVRLAPQTKELLNRKHFEMMRKDAFLINTSRGQVTHEEDLIWALQHQQIAGAGLDVFHEEPVGVDSPFLKLDNVIITPHIGWKTVDTLEDFLEETIENMKDYFFHNQYSNIVNKEVLGGLG